MKLSFAWLGLLSLLLTACDQVEMEIHENETGYRGAARVNPYLAADMKWNLCLHGRTSMTIPPWW